MFSGRREASPVCPPGMYDKTMSKPDLKSLIQQFTADVREWLPAPPNALLIAVLFLIVATWVPLVLVAQARMLKGDEPRIHLFLDMDNQAKVKAQSASPIFADGLGMRKPVAGTVAYGRDYESGRIAPDADNVAADDHLYRGFKLVENEEGELVPEYFDGIPDELEVDADFLKLGQTKYNINCASCHGYSGYGNGMVHQRAQEIMDSSLDSYGSGWVAPTSLHDENIRNLDPNDPRPDGHLYNTIRNGIRNMKGYGHHINVEERWAIVAYIRALQISQNPPDEVVSAASSAGPSAALDTPTDTN